VFNEKGLKFDDCATMKAQNHLLLIITFANSCELGV